MKYIGFILGIFILVSCNSQRLEKIEVSKKPDINQEIEGTKVEVNRPLQANDTPKTSEREINALKTDTLNQWTVLQEDTLRIETETGKVEFISTPNLEEESSDFSYKGFNEDNLFHAICGLYWEKYECYLVDHKTSEIDTIWTEPIFSPSNQVLVSKSMDYGLEGIPNGFQIWHLNQNRNWIKTMEIDQQKWVPIKLNWISNDSVLVKTVTIEHYNQMNSQVWKLTDFDNIGFRVKNETR